MALTALGVSAIAQGVGGLVSSIFGSGRKRKARNAAKKLEKKIQYLENNRQEVVNPFSGVTDLSGDFTNPFSNLTVANQAAEFQASQTDTALAGALDTARVTGQGAGGATALAQAAVRSKSEISASIEQQEAANARLMAEGQVRLQAMTASEKARVQIAQASGAKFMFGAQENREMQKLNRLSGQQDQQTAMQMNAQTQQDAGLGSFFGGMAGLAAFGFENKAA